MSSELDVLIRNAFIIDGTGRPGFKESIGIKDGRIIEVGEIKGVGSGREIDAQVSWHVLASCSNISCTPIAGVYIKINP